MSKINVRLVPRSESSAPLARFANQPSTGAHLSVNPSTRAFQRARRAVEDRAIRDEPTPLKRLSLELEESEFHEMFGDVALHTDAARTAKAPSVTMQESFRKPQEQLKVPEALSDSVAFAYVPRPVEFFAPSAIPPHEDIYHLRLSDVSAALNAPRCHRNGWTGRGAKVAMADTGFMLHPHFLRGGYKLIPTQAPGSGPADIDASGHGTGEAANIFAIAPDCTVFGVKHGSSSAATLETCIAQGPDVMTNSWGYDIDHQSRETLEQTDPNMFLELLDLEAVITSAVTSGITVLFSAGNGHLAFPACHPDVIAVGGVTVNEDSSLEASNYASAFHSQLYPGRNVPDFCGIVGRSETPPQSAHIMLPVPPDAELDGENFPSGASGTGWGIFSGTSAACPQAAGLVALLKQIARGLDPAQVGQVLAARAVDIESGQTATGASAATGPDLATGAGLVDALRACGFVSGVA
ncbi:S8 family serine peptidase [Amaricoccus macauensis]|uniref:S8 family serine peptidase n=1 Tax=Amaricoccus macauensis TaxID=57001 RepID=UPI003C7E449A